MISRLKWPIFGTLAAIAVTTTMDANGLTAFSALPLLPLALAFVLLQRLKPPEIGVAWGTVTGYALAIAYPLAVVGLAAMLAIAAGAAHVDAANWQKAAVKFALIATTTVLAVFLTEEGFFRGWLWASLSRAGLQGGAAAICTSVAFALWHLSWVTLAKGYTLPPDQIAIFMVNAALIGLVWGLLRFISGSIVVSSVSHGLWNGAVYVLFGASNTAGALGVANHVAFGPEVGILGLVLNGAFAAALWFFALRRPQQAGARSQTLGGGSR
jgi:membrane protease YdiL (CAAX protease family)